MTYLLMFHISLGVVLVLSFIVRLLGIVSRKLQPKDGRFFVGGLGTALVASGVALEIVTRAPLTSVCLSSLAIIAGIIGLEYGLHRLVKSGVVAASRS